MYFLEASAIRIGKVVEVTITGMLANSCVEATIEDFYPGGSIVYVRDPGAAQVFIVETLRPGSQYCTFGLVPWARTIAIPDDYHDKVQIIINGDIELVTEIVDAGSPEEINQGQFKVIALTSSVGGELLGCSAIPEAAVFPAIYSKVFGPDTLEACEAWIAENCKDPTPEREQKLSALKEKMKGVMSLDYVVLGGSKLKDRGY